MRLLTLTTALFILVVAPLASAADDFASAVDLTPLRTVAVQHRQTIKALDTYARQTLSTITGHSTLAGHDALYTVIDIAYRPDEYAKRNLIKIRNVPLRKEFQRLSSINADEADRIVKEGTISLNFWMQGDVQQ